MDTNSVSFGAASNACSANLGWRRPSLASFQLFDLEPRIRQLLLRLRLLLQFVYRLVLRFVWLQAPQPPAVESGFTTGGAGAGNALEQVPPTCRNQPATASPRLP